MCHGRRGNISHVDNNPAPVAIRAARPNWSRTLAKAGSGRPVVSRARGMMCDDRGRGAFDLLLGMGRLSLPVPALVHLAFHHHFHGAPFDYLGLAAAAAASWLGVPGPGEPVL